MLRDDSPDKANEIANAEFIVTACNNYQALKEENTLLKEVNEAQIFTIEKYQKENKSLTTQLAKANSDKERLGKILKEHLAEIESSMKLLKDYEGNEVMNSLSKLNVGYEDKANQIEQTLQDCGITL
jgi:predicted RNase H-like nuclease (RuvC/YqgF family)